MNISYFILSNVTTFRMIERSVSLGVGTLCVLFGMYIFWKKMDEKDGEAELELKGIKLVLKKFGSGIFFTIIGAVIISILASMKVEAYDNKGKPIRFSSENDKKATIELLNNIIDEKIDSNELKTKDLLLKLKMMKSKAKAIKKKVEELKAK